MARYHVNKNTGEVGTCKAAKDGCPFGSVEEHHNSVSAAEQARDKYLESQYSTVNAVYKGSRSQSDADAIPETLKKRMIQEAAEGKNRLHPSVVGKVFSRDNSDLIRRKVLENIASQKLVRSMASDKSDKVRALVAKTTRNPEVLKTLSTDSEKSVRNNAISNKKTPAKSRKEALAARTGKKEAKAERLGKFNATNKTLDKMEEIKYGEEVVDKTGRLWTAYSRNGSVELNTFDQGYKTAVVSKSDTALLSQFGAVKRDRVYLEDKLGKLENSPARHNYGFPEDEMTRYNIEEGIKGLKKEIGELKD